METADEWRFPLKAANGSTQLYERSQFNRDVLPDFSVLWGRNLQGGRIEAEFAQPATTAAPRYDLSNCTMER
jgi:hypothetical protein